MYRQPEKRFICAPGDRTKGRKLHYIDHSWHHFVPVAQIRDVEVIMLNHFVNDTALVVQAQGV